MIKEGVSMSKGYTIAFFINELESKVGRNSSVNNVISTISPRYGLDSVKLNALNVFVGNFTNVANGTGKYAGFGKTPRTRLLKALKMRKKFGFTV